jgi:hypothetical protein
MVNVAPVTDVKNWYGSFLIVNFINNPEFTNSHSPLQPITGLTGKAGCASPSRPTGFQFLQELAIIGYIQKHPDGVSLVIYKVIFFEFGHCRLQVAHGKRGLSGIPAFLWWAVTTLHFRATRRVAPP